MPGRKKSKVVPKTPTQLPRRSVRHANKQQQDATATDVEPQTIPETQDSPSSPMTQQSASSSFNELDLTDDLELGFTPMSPGARPAMTCDSGSGCRPIRLFRGARDPLSAFFHHPLRWRNHLFISAEVAYQHEKFIHHRQPHRAISELLRSKTSYEAKRLSVKWVPLPLQSWQSMRFAVMEEICQAKLQQCRDFREALRGSSDALLVHNTETDSTWGCGRDFLGKNKMGRILMDLRRNDRHCTDEYLRHFPPLVADPRGHSTKQPYRLTSLRHPPTSPAVPPAKKQTEQVPAPQSPSPAIQRVYVVGNSNARGLAPGLCERRVDATASIYPGQTISQIRDKIHALGDHFEKSRPDVALIHAGDIEARDWNTSVDSIKGNMEKLCADFRSLWPSTRVIISGLPCVPGSGAGRLNSRIFALNDSFKKLCGEGDFLCNKDAKLCHDKIHLTAQAKNTLARTAAQLVKPSL